MDHTASYTEGENAQKVFMEKYENVIETLKSMPKETKEEKAARYDFFKKNQTDEMLKLLFQAVKPQDAKTLFADWGGSEDIRDSKVVNTAFSDLKSLEKSQELFKYFTEALQKQCRVYTGVTSSGQEYSFFQALGKEIEHIKSLDNPERKLVRERTRISTDAQYRIMKCARLLESAYSIDANSGSWDTLKKRAQQLNIECLDGKMSEKECSLVADYVLKTGAFQLEDCLDAPIGDDEDGENVHKELKYSDEDAASNIEREDAENTQKQNRQNYFQMLTDPENYYFLINSKKELFTGAKRADWEWIVWFTQVSILIVLKLRKTDQARGKEYGISAQKEIFSKRKEDSYDYYRYTEEPAGDGEIYELLSPLENLLYDTILDKRYLEKAFSKERFPEDFYDVYHHLLEDSFNFSNKVQAECLGKSESVVSKKLTRYRTVLLPQLEKWFEIMKEN
ncbi:MAG: hypothetical protein SO101_11700 [Lachnospiraceae bacterium]|nr:hypothetical protein [Lachnospiraceae bacterium]